MTLQMASASSQTLVIEPGPNGIGAEVSGVNLADVLSDELVAELKQALVAHKVLLFRDQEMNSQDQLAFAVASVNSKSIHLPRSGNSPLAARNLNCLW